MVTIDLIGNTHTRIVGCVSLHVLKIKKLFWDIEDET